MNNKTRQKLLQTARLEQDHVEDAEITQRLTPSERLEIMFELSDFMYEVHDAPRRRR